MSKAYNSPTARLLQSSRLFSLPRALPLAPHEDQKSTGSHYTSETATKLYPTHQAIATPSSSHSRGDWGLKRPIPGKTTKASNPTIRVLGQDTPDHITEFESATDHERTRAKWAEMGIPILTSSRRRPISVYEDSIDNTDPDAAPVNLRSGPGADTAPLMVEAKRWKFSGPFIASMHEGEFTRLVERQLKGRREEWTEFLLDHFAEENYEKERRLAQQNGEWYGPAACAPPRFSAQLIISPAEQKAAELVKEARAQKSQELEAKAREKGEELVIQARRLAQKYENEANLEEAPEEARNIIIQAKRTAKGERSMAENSEEEVDPVELENRINAILADGYAAAYNRLGVEGPEGSIDESALSRLISRVEKDIRTKQAEKNALQDEWMRARIPALRPSLKELAVLEKQLRDEHNSLGSPLVGLLTRFLDIPSVNDKDPMQTINAVTRGLNRHVDSITNDREEAPPTTHPAAGLSHLRTNAYMENHPVYGPQAHHSPVLSRVLKTRNSLRGATSQAMLGVGGFVARDPNSGPTFSRNSNSAAARAADADPTNLLDPSSKTGNKIYTRPISASVNEAGRVLLHVARADAESIAVKEGDVEAILRGRAGGAAAGVGGMLRRSTGFLPPLAPRANFGFALPNRQAERQQRKQRRAEIAAGSPGGESSVGGFDGELGRRPGGAGEGDAMRDIAELSRGFRP